MLQQLAHELVVQAERKQSSYGVSSSKGLVKGSTIKMEGWSLTKKKSAGRLLQDAGGNRKVQ